tara:strand:+ start:10657 stop:11358 length:702 start_codon:yes stop_codon:yes gene_type:complete
MKKLLAKLHSPLFRYSGYFKELRNAVNYNAKEQIMEDAMEYVVASELDGDYMEFGTYRGKSFVAAYHLAKMRKLDKMHFWAFDSFEGLPKLTGVDADGFQHFKGGQYECSVGDFKAIMRDKLVDLKDYTIVKGFFDKSLKDMFTLRLVEGRKAAVILMDADLYESTVPALDFITPLVQDGTVLIFDDWYSFRADPNRGERQAFKEWLAKNKNITVTQFRKYGWQHNSFILHVK